MNMIIYLSLGFILAILYVFLLAKIENSKNIVFDETFFFLIFLYPISLMIFFISLMIFLFTGIGEIKNPFYKDKKNVE